MLEMNIRRFYDNKNIHQTKRLQAKITSCGSTYKLVKASLIFCKHEPFSSSITNFISYAITIYKLEFLERICLFHNVFHKIDNKRIYLMVEIKLSHVIHFPNHPWELKLCRNFDSFLYKHSVRLLKWNDLQSIPLCHPWDISNSWWFYNLGSWYIIIYLCPSVWWDSQQLVDLLWWYLI